MGAPPAPARDERREQRRRRQKTRELLIIAGLVVALGVLAALVISTAGIFTSDKVADTGPAGGAAASPSASAAVTSPSPSPTPKPTATSFSVTAGGDVIGGFSVADQLAAIGDGVMAGVAPWFEKSDFGFVNLESPLTTGGDPQTWKDVVIKGDPRLAEAMAAQRHRVVTMANNHAGDQGDSGLLDTIQNCREQGITIVGAGRDLAQRPGGHRAQQTTGLRVAFLGFTDVLPVGYPATPTSPGHVAGPGRPRRRDARHRRGRAARRLRRSSAGTGTSSSRRRRRPSSRARARRPSTPAPTSSSPTIPTCSTACRPTTAGSSSTASATWSSAAGPARRRDDDRARQVSDKRHRRARSSPCCIGELRRPLGRRRANDAARSSSRRVRILLGDLGHQGHGDHPRRLSVARAHQTGATSS